MPGESGVGNTREVLCVQDIRLYRGNIVEGFIVEINVKCFIQVCIE